MPSDRSHKEKNPAAVELGRLGGLRGGPARAAKLTPEQRSDIARKAARARWKLSQESSASAPSEDDFTRNRVPASFAARSAEPS